MPREPRLVVVDQSLDTRDVLRAVFQPRGVSVERRPFPCEPGSPQCTPGEPAADNDDVFILDEDSCPEGWLQSQADLGRRPRVVIGTVELEQHGESDDMFLSKPFQYAELIRAVEHMLEFVDHQPRRAA